MRWFYIFLAFVLAPIIIIIGLGLQVNQMVILAPEPLAYTYDRPQLNPIDSDISAALVNPSGLVNQIQVTEETISVYMTNFLGFVQAIEASISDSINQRSLSDDIYEQRIQAVLGQPVDYYIDPSTEIKVFELAELDYRGYIAKVKLFNPYVFKLALAEDMIGGLETLTDGAERTGAIFAINGGGFGRGYLEEELVSTMSGATVIDGELVKPFYKSPDEDLFFVGTDRYGNLVGTIPHTEEDILDLDPYQGASFIPILIKDGVKQDIPVPWKNTRHPRTIIGQYANNDLIFIVIDGRQSDWSSGISLEDLQDKLLNLGVIDAYNLDGGGSTAMYFKGNILNKPSDGQVRRIANFFMIKP